MTGGQCAEQPHAAGGEGSNVLSRSILTPRLIRNVRPRIKTDSMLSLPKIFRPLYGKPSWNVKRGWGSFLTFEFGEPHLHIRERRCPKRKMSPKVRRLLARRGVTVRGEWHLWIYCCDWRVRVGHRVVGHSRSKAGIDRAAQELDGQALTRVAALPQPGCTRFEFDLGRVLETQPYDEESEQWFLYDAKGYVLTMRWDGLCSYEPGDRPNDQAIWHRVRSGLTIRMQPTARTRVPSAGKFGRRG